MAGARPQPQPPESEPGPPRRRLCLNCDNRHGCRTAAPPCESLERAPEEIYLSGKALMARRGLLLTCKTCGHFRRCWAAEPYQRALAGRGR